MVKYTREILEPLVKRNVSIAGVVRDLGLKQAGGTHSNIKRRIVEYGFDTSHMTGQSHMRGKPGIGKKPSIEVLTIRGIGATKVKTRQLRNAMIDTGIKHECSKCGVGGEWFGEKLVLQIDHIDGNSLDSRRENVRFMCPNCHSQTPSYCKKKSSLNK